MPRLSSPLAPLLAGAVCFAGLVLAPGAWDGWVPGTAYSTLAAALLVLTVVVIASLAVVAPVRRVSWRPVWTIAALLVARLVIGSLDQPAGWRGEYAMRTPDPMKVGAFAWRLGVHSFRVDRQLVFEGADFDLQFLNDFHRYNAAAYAPPRAVSEGLRMTWTGWFDAANGALVSLHAQARGTMDVRLDGRAWVSVDDEAPVEPPQIAVGRGWHRLDLVYEKPAEVVPAVFVHLLLDGRPLKVSPWPRPAGATTALLRPLSNACLGFGVVAWLWLVAGAFRTAGVRRGAARGGAVMAIAAMGLLAIWAVSRADAVSGLTQELRPGDDHLAYEGLARNILEEGLLMPEGRRHGQGRPFFFYPLYSYALAAMHVALGDGYGAVVLMNAAAAVLLPVLFWLLGWRALPAGAQLAGQALLVAFVLRHNARYVDSPLTDNLFIPLIIGTLVLAVRAVRSSRPLDAFVTGCAVAACATTRPSAFLLLAPLSLLLAYTATRTNRWGRIVPVGALLAGYAVALAPVVLRNWIMAGEAVAMVTLSHAIPISLIPPEVPRPASMLGPAILSWSSSLHLAWTIIQADPWGVAWLELRKVLFTLGLTGLGPPGSPTIWEFPPLALLGATAFALRRVPNATTAVLLVFLASHLAAITIAYPWTYGYKTILPVQLLLLFAALHLLAPASRRATHV